MSNTKSRKTATVAPVERTSRGMASCLAEELDALRSGNSTPTRANAVAKLVGGMVDLVRLEMQAAKFMAQHSGKGAEPRHQLAPLKLT